MGFATVETIVVSTVANFFMWRLCVYFKNINLFGIICLRLNFSKGLSLKSLSIHADHYFVVRYIDVVSERCYEVALLRSLLKRVRKDFGARTVGLWSKQFRVYAIFLYTYFLSIRWNYKIITDILIAFYGRWMRHTFYRSNVRFCIFYERLCCLYSVVFC